MAALGVRNLRIDGARDGGLVLISPPHVSVRSCDIRGTSADHEAPSIASGSSDVEVFHCRVHDNGEERIAVKHDDDARVKIHANVVTNNRGPNIYVNSSTSVDVYNNVVSGVKNTPKARIGLTVENGNVQAGLSLWVESSRTMSDVQIVTNTFSGKKRGSIVLDADRLKGNNVLRNNIFADGSVPAGPFTGDHNGGGDPGFADPACGDFRLAPGATAAVDTGSADLVPALDLDGTTRPASIGYDIDACEQRDLWRRTT